MAAKSHELLNHYDALLKEEKDAGRRLALREEANEAVAAMRRMPVGFGIEAVDPSSDLASKNVVAGDIITYINDKQVTSYDVLANELAEFKPGDTVKLTIYRSSSSGGAGRSFEVNVVLIESAGE